MLTIPSLLVWSGGSLRYHGLFILSMQCLDHVSLYPHALFSSCSLNKRHRNTRYVDCASNSVLETTAMAHPSTPASQLYEMARLIEANITMRTADWLKHKILPT